MGKRTPREFWEATVPGGFDEGMAWVERIYGDIDRIKPSETKDATGPELWKCYLTEQGRPRRGSKSVKPPNYFTTRLDKAKIEQFKKDVKDIQGMAPRQLSATMYASRQVMAYLADALYDGKGLPERGGERRIYATDGMWTGRLRREWGLFFDPHDKKAKGLDAAEEHSRKEKDRGDHRHHAIDAIVIAYCSRSVQIAWEEREKSADRDGVNTANEEAMEAYRRNNPLPPPAPFRTRKEFREAVRRAVFGDSELEKPICRRPVKRKLIGELHEAFPRGPVLDKQGAMTDKFTKKISVFDLKPNHLRVPDGWDERSAKLDEASVPQSQKRAIRKELASMPDLSPGKSGIVRDRALRDRIRKCLRSPDLDLGVLDPRRNTVKGGFTKSQLKKAIDAGKLKHASGVPINSVVLLWTVKEPVIISRSATDHATGNRYREYDASSNEGNAAAARAYIGGNQHHIEIRISQKGKWSGDMVSAFEAAQRKLARLRAFREAGIPKPESFRELPKVERNKFTPILRAIELAHPLVDRRDDDAKGGRFVMSLCEGETLLMKHKRTKEVGYFVVAKLDKPRSIVLVPHWDARAAKKGRKDAEGKRVPDSTRDEFSATPTDLEALAPPGHKHAVKVRVSPLGEIRERRGD